MAKSVSFNSVNDSFCVPEQTSKVTRGHIKVLTLIDLIYYWEHNDVAKRNEDIGA